MVEGKTVLRRQRSHGKFRLIRAVASRFNGTRNGNSCAVHLPSAFANRSAMILVRNVHLSARNVHDSSRNMAQMRPFFSSNGCLRYLRSVAMVTLPMGGAWSPPAFSVFKLLVMIVLFSGAKSVDSAMIEVMMARISRRIGRVRFSITRCQALGCNLVWSGY